MKRVCFPIGAACRAETRQPRPSEPRERGPGFGRECSQAGIAVPFSTHTPIKVLLALFLTVSVYAQELGVVRTPQLQTLNVFLGGWESVAADGTRLQITREWLRVGRFILEQAINENNEEEYLALWTHDPEADRYRIVTLRQGSASYMQGNWNADSATLQLDRLTDSAVHSRLSIVVEAPNRVKFASATQTRAEFAPAHLIRRRSEGLRVLQNFVGSWNSKMGKDRVEDSALTTWSRGRKGDYLVSTEGVHKASLMTFDPASRIYRGVALESGAASFSRGTWQQDPATMHHRFYAFELPRDADEKPLPDAAFEDGLNGDIRDLVYHKFNRQVEMVARIGGTEVWKGNGQVNLDIDQARIWPATLTSHPGKALTLGNKFKRQYGFGETVKLGPAPRALKLFFDNRAIRRCNRSDLWLNVNMNRFRAGEKVLFWRLHRVENQPHLWDPNNDHTVSPVKAPHLVLGWSDGELRLVTKDSEDRLVFGEIKK